MKKNNGAIAILGGMGPQASAKMLEVMIDMAAKEFGVKRGEDFPEIILFSIPVPDLIPNKRSIERALPMLTQRIRLINRMDVSAIAMACNTAHIMLRDLQDISRAPFVSIIETVANQAKAKGIKKIGILASTLTIKSGLYRSVLKKRKIKTIVPSKRQQVLVERIIQKVVSGAATVKDSQMLCQITDSLKKRGAQGIILGCTELPLIFPKPFSLPVFDSIRIVSRELLLRCFESPRKV